MFKKSRQKNYISGFINAHIFNQRLGVVLDKVSFSKKGGVTTINLFVSEPDLLIGKGGRTALHLSNGLSKTMSMAIKLNVEKWNK